jgi:two-component system NtrC family sensor kinase
MIGVFTGLFGWYILKKNVVDRAQRRSEYDLNAARAVFQNDLKELGQSFGLISRFSDMASLKQKLKLDYLYVVEKSEFNSITSPIVFKAAAGNQTGGVRIIDSIELRLMGEELYFKARIDIKSTPKALPSVRTALTAAMTMEYAVPFFGEDGSVLRVLYGGRLLNRNFELIDRIRDVIYENRLYNSRPVGTVTIFLDDVRIATNVLNTHGERAIGTRVSQIVYDNVIRGGKRYIDRAFVVNDWYLTSYEPIRDINSTIVGMLYVGILERPYTDMIKSTTLAFFLIMGIILILAIFLSFVLAGAISSPIIKLEKGTASLADGDLTHRVDITTEVFEINRLALSFNEMAEEICRRERKILSANDDLALLNKRYLDLIGMVSHELKGILASAIMSAYSVRDGYLGELNEFQRKAMDSVTRNLDYFDITVKNFLNLSRIEKDGLVLNRTKIHVKDEIINASVEAFSHQAEDRHMKISVAVPPEITVTADSSLFFMVVNNLLGNAIKYGIEKGQIEISASADNCCFRLSVYNDGRPLTEAEREKLFKRFSRLDSPEGRKVRGTGLGLFISREIVEAHGGSISCESREKGNAFVVAMPLTVKAGPTQVPEK